MVLCYFLQKIKNYLWDTVYIEIILSIEIWKCVREIYRNLFWTLRIRNTSLSFSNFLPNENQILMNTITKIAISLTANIRKLYFSSKWFVLDTICHRLPDVTLGWIALTSCLVHGKGRLFTPGRNDLSIFGIVLFVFWYSNTYCIR